MKNKELIEKVQNLIIEVKDYKETLPLNEQKDSNDLCNVLNSALYRLGYREKTKSSKPPKNAFSPKEEKEATIKNKPPKDAFARKELKEVVHKDIKNKPPKDAFKRKELTSEQEEKEDAIKKQGGKYNKRLLKSQKELISKLFKGGTSVEDISEELWIEEKLILKHLKIKAPSVLLADNSKNEADEFVQEVKESKE